jgi:ubiquinone/menaquinone biosynthesis C-methylase UbiE
LLTAASWWTVAVRKGHVRDRGYGDAIGYDAYMGRWSVALAPVFLHFACLGDPRSILDIGCGTGSLLRAVAKAFPRSLRVGLDPYFPFVARARTTQNPVESSYVIGATESLPFGDNVFDHCLSLLVLQEIHDRAAALREMHRVTRRNGMVAACQWDFDQGMPMTGALREALAAVAPHLEQSGSTLAFRSLAELEDCWRAAGLEDIETARLSVTLAYESFSDLWSPILSGSTPTTAVIAALPADAQEAVARKLMEIFPGALGGSRFSSIAHAFAIRGRAST